VDLRKGSGAKGYHFYSALVDSGASYNFITQSFVDMLRLEAVEAGRSKVKKLSSPPITRANSELLRATAVI
jgi:hypothetical protein